MGRIIRMLSILLAVWVLCTGASLVHAKSTGKIVLAAVSPPQAFTTIPMNSVEVKDRESPSPGPWLPTRD